MNSKQVASGAGWRTGLRVRKAALALLLTEKHTCPRCILYSRLLMRSLSNAECAMPQADSLSAVWLGCFNKSYRSCNGTA
jgi:hypothetical protein